MVARLPVVARFFVVARLIVVLRNQGRHGGLPLRSTPPLGQPPVVARFVRRYTESGQGEWLDPAFALDESLS